MSLKIKFLRFLKRIWLFSAIRRFIRATSYYNFRYAQIMRWVFSSNEFTNFNYEMDSATRLYLAQAIAIVTEERPSYVLDCFEELENDKVLIEHIQKRISLSDEGRYADLDISFARRIGWYALIRIQKPKIIIETGVDKGLGSVVICSALMRNKKEGHIGAYYGTDINPKAGYMLSAPYSEFGEILFGDSIKSLKKFKEKVDLFINDSDHSAEYEREEYEVIVSKLSENAIILGDNSHFTDVLGKFSFEKNRKFIFAKEKPKNHWYPGGGVGISY